MDDDWQNVDNYEWDNTNNNEWNNDAQNQDMCQNEMEFGSTFLLKKLGIELNSEYEGDMVLCEARQKFAKNKTQEYDDDTTL